MPFDAKTHLEFAEIYEQQARAAKTPQERDEWLAKARRKKAQAAQALNLEASPAAKPRSIQCQKCFGTGQNKHGGPCRQCRGTGQVNSVTAVGQTLSELGGAITQIVFGFVAFVVIVVIIIAAVSH